ncbi:MAG: hypothetical protein GX483_07140 [Actinomycetaceae bacterium]|nr:hypothetical protein [Actinomycetaceae bacterium]
MTTAPRADQLQLLNVAQLDAAINRLRRSDAQHPLRATLGDLMNLVAAQGLEISQTQEKLTQAEKDLEEASARSLHLAHVIAEKEARYNAGTGMDSRELLTLGSEIDTNREMLDEIVEEEFEALTAVEELTDKLAELRSELEVLQGKIVAERAELEDEVAQIQSEITEISRQRAQLFDHLDDGLKTTYERAVARGGLAVIALHPDGTTSGGVQISPIEIAQIRNADPDRVHISEDYGCIVVAVDTYN